MKKKLSTKILLVTFGLYILRHIYRNCVKVSDKVSSSNILKPLSCPDNWIKTGDNICKNINNIGRCNNLLNGDNHTMEEGREKIFDLSIYHDPIKGEFEKCRWAKLCGISWTGIDHLCV